MTKDEALKRALEQRITDYLSFGGLFNPELADHVAVRDLLMDCRKALAQPAPVAWSDYESNGIHHKPVAWMDADGNVSDNNDHNCFPIPLYTTPPQRTWVGLTDWEISQLWISTSPYFNEDDFAKAIEAKLRSKNT